LFQQQTPESSANSQAQSQALFPEVKKQSETNESANAKLSDIQMKQIHDQEQKLRDHNDKVLKYLESSLP